MKKLNVNTVNHDEWLTPPEIIKAFPQFDLDPCAPVNRPWPTAKEHYTKDDDGLSKDWWGCVWMNLPYGSECQKWLAKLAAHGNGIALVFARTETKMFKNYVFDKADALLFVHGRICFHKVDGSKSKNSGGAPSVLIAYGSEAFQRLKNANIQGRFISLEKEGKGE